MVEELQTAINVDSDKAVNEPLTGKPDQPSVAFTKVENTESVEVSGTRPQQPGLTKEELMKFANDPKWVRIRWTVFVLYWVIWVGMFVGSVIIIWTADRCPAPLAGVETVTAAVNSVISSTGSNI